MRVRRAEFWAAASEPRAIPAAVRPEVAVAGRSNVGKSSLINRLVGRKRLVRTSSTPGCTRGLLFFNVDDRLTLVDLPGYGWARRSKGERRSWKRLVEGYLADRPALCGVLILVDVRRGPEDEERMLAEFLDSRGIKRTWVLTKADKLPRGKLRTRTAELREKILGDDEDAVVTSARSGEGIEDLWRGIEQAVCSPSEGTGRSA